MELRAVVVLRLDVSEKVLDCLRRCIGRKLEPDLAGGGVQIDLGIRTASGSGGEREADHGCKHEQMTAEHR